MQGGETGTTDNPGLVGRFFYPALGKIPVIRKSPGVGLGKDLRPKDFHSKGECDYCRISF